MMKHQINEETDVSEWQTLSKTKWRDALKFGPKSTAQKKKIWGVKTKESQKL